MKRIYYIAVVRRGTLNYKPLEHDIVHNRLGLLTLLASEQPNETPNLKLFGAYIFNCLFKLICNKTACLFLRNDDILDAYIFTATRKHRARTLTLNTRD